MNNDNSWVEQTLRDFGHSLGIEALGFNQHAVVMLSFDVSGDLYIEQIEDAILVYLVRQQPRIDQAMMRKALQLCHYRQQGALAVNVALKKQDQLVFLVRIQNRDFSQPNLENAFQFLLQCHEQL